MTAFEYLKLKQPKRLFSYNMDYCFLTTLIVFVAVSVATTTI